VSNLTTGVNASDVRVTPDGRFSASVPLAPLTNRLEVRARAQDGSERSALVEVSWQDADRQEALRRAERERMERRRALERELTIEAEPPQDPE
jgi:hypothetical protein